MKNILKFLRNFLSDLPNTSSKVFTRNQDDAETLVSEIQKVDKEVQENEASYQDAKDKCTQLLSGHVEFLTTDGFTPKYIAEKRSRFFILLFTPIFSGISIATGVYIIFGINIGLAILVGLMLSFLSFFLALNDKFLENHSNKRSYTFIIFLTLDAIILFVGLIIGLISQIPKEFLIVHSLLCIFAVVLNFFMLKHASKYHEDKVRKKIKRSYDELNVNEKILEKNLKNKRQERRKIFNELRILAVKLRREFVTQSYLLTNVLMSRDTRMVINHFIGYDLFPLTGERIVPKNFRWNSDYLTVWPENTSSPLPRIFSELWYYPNRQPENGISDADRQYRTEHTASGEPENQSNSVENPETAQDRADDNPGVNQPYDSEIEL